ncbi:MAG TPA: ABC transporter permease, partial [Aestuariivirgaceae bacterium]
MSTAAASYPLRGIRLRRFLSDYGQEIVVCAAIATLFIAVGAFNPRFLSNTNINSIFAGNAYI